MKDKICVLSASPKFRKGVSSLLSDLENVSTAEGDSSCDAALNTLSNFYPKVILIDIQFPTLLEIETISCILDKYPDAKILAFIPVPDYFAAIELINHGVLGVITHEIGMLELAMAIKSIANKESYFCKTIIKAIKDKYYKSPKKSIPLSITESQLLKEIATASTAAESCERLSISLEDYLMTRNTLFEKTNCTTNSSLAVYSYMTSGLPSGE